MLNLSYHWSICIIFRCCLLATEHQWTGTWLICVQGKRDNQYKAIEAPDRWKAKGVTMQRPPPSTLPSLHGVRAARCGLWNGSLDVCWCAHLTEKKWALLVVSAELHMPEYAWPSVLYMSIHMCVLLSLRCLDSPPLWASHGSITAKLIYCTHSTLGLETCRLPRITSLWEIYTLRLLCAKYACDIVQSNRRAAIWRMQCSYRFGLIRLVLIVLLRMSSSVILMEEWKEH